MPLQIVIEMGDDGTVKVHGPLENKLLMYGLLEAVRDIVQQHQPSPIVRPDITVVPSR